MAVHSWYTCYDCCGLLVIVAWHRFILLEDSTHFLLPKFHGRQILSYMWRVILIVLLFIPFYLAYFALALIFADVSQFNFTALSLLAFASTCIYYVLLYRLSPILPAAAHGNKLSFGEAIKATKGATFSFGIFFGTIERSLQLCRTVVYTFANSDRYRCADPFRLADFHN